jgi:hypothetical protein
VKLALLINDVFDSVERSKIGNIYCRKEDGSVLTTPEGTPYANMAAVNMFSTILQTVLIKDKVIYEE